MAKLVQTNLDFNSVAKPINLPDPTDAQDAATKAYVDSAVEGLAWKASARVATSSNINLSSPGSSLDGVALSTSDRVLVKGQTTQSQNGVYIWNGASVAMTRSADCSTARELEQAIISVEEGTSAGATFRQESVNFTLGSGAITWTNFGTVAPAASESTPGIAEIATQGETDAGTDDARMVTPLKLATYSGRKLKYATDIGDGSATQFTITHNLGTRDLTVAIYRNSGSYDEVFADVEHTTTNTCTVRFSSAPTSNQFRVVVLG